MTKKQLMLAAKFLDQLSEQMGNAGCNDWDWPEDWSGCERDQFAREYHTMNGEPEVFEPGMGLHDFGAVDLLSEALRKMAV